MWGGTFKSAGKTFKIYLPSMKRTRKSSLDYWNDHLLNLFYGTGAIGKSPNFFGGLIPIFFWSPKANAVEWVGSCNKVASWNFCEKVWGSSDQNPELFVQSKVATVLTRAFVWRTKLEQMNVELEHVAASSALKKRPVWHQVILQNVLAVWNLRIMALCAIGQIRYAKPSLKNTSSDHYLI